MTCVDMGSYGRRTKYKIKIGTMTSDAIISNVGLRQGDAVSEILFNFVLDNIIK